MSGAAAVIAIVVLGPLALGLLFGGRLPGRFRDRRCQGIAWRRAFPNASKDAIREFLSMFVDAFAVKQSERLKLGPEDRIFDVYRAIYPSRLLADNLELETFASDLERRFGLRLETMWNERLTLGEVFEVASSVAAA